uniref:Uncharacterized protein LOC113793012 n=1 Tax=Dermatophagoides pteronyssinus TaxID=6956 RepID=A0A6P6XZX4_DERPT|nr:uncharacterized protein LOC113793012 [Dermatophagoides pteronyssinus]
MKYFEQSKTSQLCSQFFHIIIQKFQFYILYLAKHIRQNNINNKHCHNKNLTKYEYPQLRSHHFIFIPFGQHFVITTNHYKFFVFVVVVVIIDNQVSFRFTQIKLNNYSEFVIACFGHMNDNHSQ